MENRIARDVEDAAYEVHYRLGPGLLETVYQRALSHELALRGVGYVEELAISIRYKSMTFDDGFRADFVVENKVILELKSIEVLAPVHTKQLLTYLRFADRRLGLLINFGAPLIKDGIRRVVNGLKE